MISLLDTSAILAFVRGEPGARGVKAIIDDKEHDLVISALTLAELARRLRELGADESCINEEVATATVFVSRVVPVNVDIATTAFDVYAKTPKRLPIIDSLIAATAVCEGARLIHRDRHMSAIPTDVVAQLDLTKE